MTLRINSKHQALTLLELLLVIAIIAVLVGLLLPVIVQALSNADNKTYGWTVTQEYEATKDRLRSFFATHTATRSWTKEELTQYGVFDSYVLKWMKTGRIHYYPFTTNDTNDAIVMTFWFSDKVWDDQNHLFPKGEDDLAIEKSEIFQ